MNFPISEQGLPLSAVSGASTTYDVSASNRYSPDILIYNPGPATVYIRAGAADVSANVLSMPIPPKTKEVYRKGLSTHLAVISSSGSQEILVFFGEGV